MASKGRSLKAQEAERLIHVRLASELHRRLRVQVAEEDTTIQDWVAALIEREIARLEAKRADGKR